MTTIYCDEAGNTGANILNPEQPFFVLASNDLSDEEANSLLEHVRLAQGAEPKFSTLRRRPEGIARVIRLLADPRLNADRVRISVFHKRYMVVSKMVDLVAESLIHHIGGDLYERGANIAMSNLLYYCMPVFCGEGAGQVLGKSSRLRTTMSQRARSIAYPNVVTGRRDGTPHIPHPRDGRLQRQMVSER